MTDLEKSASKYVDEKPDSDGFYDAFIAGYNEALRTRDIASQNKQLTCGVLHSTDWSGKCFNCGKQVFIREPK